MEYTVSIVLKTLVRVLSLLPEDSGFKPKKVIGDVRKSIRSKLLLLLKETAFLDRETFHHPQYGINCAEVKTW